MANTIPYLFLGNKETTEKAFEFYKGIGIKVKNEMRATKEQAKDWGIEEGQLIYAQTQWGGSDNVNRIDMSGHPSGMVSGSVMLDFNKDEQSKKKMEEIYHYLKKDGDVKMELGKPFWGGLFAFVIDKFGIVWQLSYPE